jgi:hypothetical protein
MSSFFDEASLVMIPSGYKDQKVYSVKPLDGSGDLTFSRASSATRVASNGLIEKVRTNLALYSEQFDNAYWGKTNTTVVANSSIAPNGTTTAELVYPNSSGSSRLLEKSFSISNSTPYTGTWYAKASGLNWVAIDHIDGNVGAWFNLSTGTIGTVSAGTTASIENVGNGWYRCRISRTSAGTTGYHDIRLVDGDNVTSVTASGTNGVLVWGAQLETGDIATDYIATTTAAVSVGPVSGLPRLDYLGSTCGKLLLEPQRSNLMLYSEQFDNAYWTKSNTAITANNVTSPDGYTNADLITASGSGSVTHVVNRSITTTSGSVYAFSVFAKKGTTDWIALRHDSGGTFNYFNLATGTKGATCDASATIENYGNGWYRLTVLHTATGSNGGEIYVATANGTISFAAAGQTLYIYGAQYELGAYATSYIPTLGTSVTRVADAASKTGISSLIGQTEGTIYWEGKIDGFSANNEALPVSLFATGADINGAQIYIVLLLNRSIRFVVYDGTNIQASVITSAGFYTFGTTIKVAAVYKANDFALYINGVQIGTDTSGSVVACSELSFDYQTYVGKYSTDQVLLFKTRLSNADLAALTA